MKNGSILEELKLPEQEVQSRKRKTEVNLGGNQENLLSINLRNKETDDRKNKLTSNSFISSLSFGTDILVNQEEQISKPKKKRRIRRQ